MAFTALATRLYKDPITTVYLNSIKQNDDYFLTATFKAWVNFDGSAAALSARSSQNIASLTDSGVGSFLITFTTGFTTTGYMMVGNTYRDNADRSTVVQIESGSNMLDTSTAHITVADGSNTKQDASVMVSFFGLGK